MPPGRAWSDQELVELAGDLAFRRGCAYAAEGRVTNLIVNGDALSAQVLGRQTYQVALAPGASDCDCPVGERAEFCKHCVAVAVAARGTDTTAPHNLREHLESLSNGSLVDLVLEAAQAHPPLSRRLTLAAARAIGGTDDLRRAVEQSLGIHRELDYWQALDHAKDCQEVIAELTELVNAGRASDAIPLVERGIVLLERLIGRSDDGGGGLGDALDELLALHAVACRAAPPDPIRLARWLGKAEEPRIAAYVEALGERGLAAYRREVDRRLAASPDAFLARHARAELAKLDKDVATLADVVGGDLSTAEQHMQLADALRDIDEGDQAVAVAERGLATYRDDLAAGRLRDFLVEEYLRRGGLDDAVAVRRHELADTPSFDAYRKLRDVARRAGVWDTERAAAVAVLRRSAPAEHVRALLAEDDVDAAWRAAKTADCGLDLWDQLARRRAKTHPADALPVLRFRIDEILRRTGRDVYRDAVRRLRELRELYLRTGRGEVFAAYLGELCERYRRRPAFLEEVFRARLHA